MKRGKILALIALFFFIAGAGVTYGGRYKTAKDFVKEAKKHIKEITCDKASKLLGKKGVIFLDVREPAEYNAGHIDGAINLPRGLLEFKIAKKIPNKNATIIVYCKTGGRGALATYTLKQMGYKKVYNLKGGWLGWKKFMESKKKGGGEEEEEEEGC